MKNKTTTTNQPITIPEQARQELDGVEQMSPDFSMDDLVNWVNDAVARFYPEANEGGDKRVSNRFTVRTLRHYQTLGCLDTPEKVGRRAIYGFRHYLQALLIRKLLHLRCSPDSIRISLKGKSNEEYKAMLFEDVQIIPSKPPTARLATNPPSDPSPKPSSGSEAWIRITLGPDAELHLKQTAGRMSPARKKELLRQIERQLKNH